VFVVSSFVFNVLCVSVETFLAAVHEVVLCLMLFDVVLSGVGGHPLLGVCGGHDG
jgi:hypothetical protein